jgi:NAD(P)-dependent dehydrogenase (short-subunit alcohol dehydrogenase family)
VLTALIAKPDRLVYLSSDMHASGCNRLDDLQWERSPWDGYQAYSDTKLHDLMLSMYVARLWADVLVNALDPGWVPTQLEGANAPGNLADCAKMQVWLAVSNDAPARVSGAYFFTTNPDHSSALRSVLNCRSSG